MRSLLFVACLALLPAHRAAAESIDYVRDVKPLLRERCYACHGALKQKAKLRLDTAALMQKGGSRGPAVEPGKPDESLLIEKVTAAEEAGRMPPEGKPLTGAQIAALTEWIRQGARAPTDEQPEEDPRQHWAFRKPVRPSVPQVKNSGWARNPVDAFIATEHEKRGLVRADDADPATLLRRVYLDLTGLPPTRDELQAFLADTSSDAYEKVVDRLLASPRYAERWGRHWMDVWRYSDWYGSRHINELRYSRRHIWRWRDWIVESLDQDKGFDRMVVEMLAADEVAPGDLDAQRASGYLGRNFYVFNRNVWLQDVVEYTGAAFLGLTFKCCRCHDHKYDPLSQEDYYRFRAFFEPHRVRTDPIAGKREPLKGNIAMGSPPGANLKEGLDCVYDADLQAATFVLARGNEKDPIKDRPMTPGMPALLGGNVRIEPVSLPLAAYYPELQPSHREAALREARAAAEKGGPAEKARLEALEARIAAELAKYASPPDPRASELADSAARAERIANLRQAEADLAQAEQQLTTAKAMAKPEDAKAMSALAAAEKKVKDLQAKLAAAQKAAEVTTYTPLGTAYPPTSSGRRLGLARWITDRDNPLTARVAVNHVWLRHLGSALVPSLQNFGRNGKRPTHPELLDWLAVEFMESGWSLKHLHRLIVTSSTYRLASSGTNQGDPENRYLWRANVRRMEAEVVRDSLLHLAGRLDATRGGEDLDPVTDRVSRRRSLYFRHTPDEKPLMLETFDAADPSECFERSESVMPQQALALANGDFAHAQARLIARRLGPMSDASFVQAAFEHVLARPPHSEERVRAESFLRQHAELLAKSKGLTPIANAVAASAVAPSPDAAQRARENLVHVLLNYNEFVTIR